MTKIRTNNVFQSTAFLYSASTTVHVMFHLPNVQSNLSSAFSSSSVAGSSAAMRSLNSLRISSSSVETSLFGVPPTAPSHGVSVHCKLLPVLQPIFCSLAITSSLVHIRRPLSAQIVNASSRVLPLSHASKFHLPPGTTLRVKRVAKTFPCSLTTH